MAAAQTHRPFTCPTCGAEGPVNGDWFESDRAVAIHHKLAHGESLVERRSTCDRCGDGFVYLPSSSRGEYCSMECQLAVARPDRETPYDTFRCVWCREKSQVEAWWERTFCSYDCYWSARSWWMEGEPPEAITRG